MKPPAALLATALALAACQRAPDDRVWLGPVILVEAPAAPGSRYPNLAAGAGMPTVMSWLAPEAGSGFTLQFASWSGKDWSKARTVATGTDWFINWADFPSVVPVNSRTWAAHWLQQRPGDVYAYDVRMAVSPDAGTTWSAPMSPHEDGTPTEHGFVSILPGDGDSVRAVWLDGRHTAGEHEHATHEAAADAGAMTLRTAAIDVSGHRIGADAEIDARVCDCCQTDAAWADGRALIVYRDRSQDEVRNIYAVRAQGGGWSAPVRVHDDGWRIDACPVNGPALAARGNLVAVAWFTAPDVPRVRVTFSTDGGRTFAAPLEVASGKIAGRVDVVLLADGRAVVSWLAEGPSGAEIRAQPFTSAGAAGDVVGIARTGIARSSGFPQMALAGSYLLFAWTEAADPPRVRTARARLE
jgi:hypothetical protein